MEIIKFLRKLEFLTNYLSSNFDGNAWEGEAKPERRQNVWPEIFRSIVRPSAINRAKAKLWKGLQSKMNSDYPRPRLRLKLDAEHGCVRVSFRNRPSVIWKNFQPVVEEKLDIYKYMSKFYFGPDILTTL